MGSSYNTIVVRGAEQARIVETVEDWDFDLVVSPTYRGNTILYVEPLAFSPAALDAGEGTGHYLHEDQLIEMKWGPNVRDIAWQLSKELSCIAFATEVFDDDVNLYWLFSNGEQWDCYTSWYAVVRDLGDYDIIDEPRGGNVTLLCRTFDVPEAVLRIEEILYRKGRAIHKWMTFVASERDREIRRALALPQFYPEYSRIVPDYIYVPLGIAVMQAEEDAHSNRDQRFIRTGKRRIS